MLEKLKPATRVLPDFEPGQYRPSEARPKSFARKTFEPIDREKSRSEGPFGDGRLMGFRVNAVILCKMAAPSPSL